MKREPIDEALGRDQDCAPGPGFARRVMRAVHHARQAPLAFPWLWFAAAAVAAGLVAALLWWAFASAPVWLVVAASCGVGACGVLLLLLRESGREP